MAILVSDLTLMLKTTWLKRYRDQWRVLGGDGREYA